MDNSVGEALGDFMTAIVLGTLAAVGVCVLAYFVAKALTVVVWLKWVLTVVFSVLFNTATFLIVFDNE